MPDLTFSASGQRLRSLRGAHVQLSNSSTIVMSAEDNRSQKVAPPTLKRCTENQWGEVLNAKATIVGE